MARGQTPRAYHFKADFAILYASSGRVSVRRLIFDIGGKALHREYCRHHQMCVSAFFASTENDQLLFRSKECGCAGLYTMGMLCPCLIVYPLCVPVLDIPEWALSGASYEISRTRHAFLCRRNCVADFSWGGVRLDEGKWRRSSLRIRTATRSSRS